MILVTVGTTGFDALVRAMDGLCLTVSDEVVMQIGEGSYVPKHCEYHRFVPSLAAYYERASLVVSHGGLGTLTEVMACGLPLVAVEDPEQPDRHQQEVLRVWKQAGHLLWCRDLEALPQVLEEARYHRFTRYQPPECTIHLRIAEYLQGVQRRP